MRTVIRTKYTTTATGAGRILAKGGGRQKTINYDQSISSDRNHGNAAGELALMLGLPWHDGIVHDCNDSGTMHGFEF
jgi:hypothetical protein